MNSTMISTTPSPLLAQFRLLSPDATLPSYGTPQSACFDISACLPVGTVIRSYTEKNDLCERTLTQPTLSLRPRERYLIPTGWAVACPIGHSLRLYSRSGLSLKHGLLLVNGVGVVDEDYRHEVCVLFMNMSACAIDIDHGMRICQGEFLPNAATSGCVMTPVTVSDAEWFTTTRVGGFGSTGVK